MSEYAKIAESDIHELIAVLSAVAENLFRKDVFRIAIYKDPFGKEPTKVQIDTFPDFKCVSMSIGNSEPEVDVKLNREGGFKATIRLD